MICLLVDFRLVAGRGGDPDEIGAQWDCRGVLRVCVANCHRAQLLSGISFLQPAVLSCHVPFQRDLLGHRVVVSDSRRVGCVDHSPEMVAGGWPDGLGDAESGCFIWPLRAASTGRVRLVTRIRPLRRDRRRPRGALRRQVHGLPNVFATSRIHRRRVAVLGRGESPSLPYFMGFSRTAVAGCRRPSLTCRTRR